MSYLPSLCEKHPNAKIIHKWDVTRYVMNGYPVGIRTKSNHHFFCSECGTEVCSEEEFENRKIANQRIHRT
jgi:hypothetical protein